MKIILENVPFTAVTGYKFNITVRHTRYPNGRHALISHCIDDDGLIPFAKMSTNIPNADIKRDEIIIKDHDENDGVLAFLYSWDIVTAPVKYENGDRLIYPVCKLLI